jgi:uncharacterized protein (TIGR03435 family)
VVDRTGLLGMYDFELVFVPDDMAPGVVPRDDDGSIGPSLFDALSEQLGLKLEASKGPLEHLIIDHVARPAEN